MKKIILIAMLIILSTTTSCQTNDWNNLKGEDFNIKHPNNWELSDKKPMELILYFLENLLLRRMILQKT